jgi:poly(3-hydroxybutyrate) depolymerase
MRIVGLALLIAVLVVVAGHADGAPGTGTFKISLKGYNTQIWVTVPSNYAKSQSKKWGLIVGLHGAGQPPGSYLGGWPANLLGNAGYVMVSPQSCTGGGVWNIDGKGDNAKECEYILRIVEKIVADYDLNPDMIHINGFSAGSAMCGAGLAGDGSFRKFKIQSFVGF